MGARVGDRIGLADLERGLQAILDFGDMLAGRGVLTRAYRQVGGASALPRAAHGLMRGFIGLGCVGRDGRRLVEVALDEMDGLTAAGRDLLVRLREAEGDLWRVERGGHVVLLRSLTRETADPIEAFDPEHPTRLRAGQLAFAWIVRGDRRRYLTESVLTVPGRHEAHVVERLRHHMTEPPAGATPADPRHLAGAHVGRLLRCLIQLRATSSCPCRR